MVDAEGPVTLGLFRALIDVALDVGLTDDALDYAVRLAMPIRFDLPIPRLSRATPASDGSTL